MGRRFLKSSIIQPLNDCKEIQLRYDSIEELMNKDLFGEPIHNIKVLRIEHFNTSSPLVGKADIQINNLLIIKDFRMSFFLLKERILIIQ
jgi:hypothetical protein